MSYYDYKIVPAPKRAKKVKGVSGAADLFALTLNDAVNELARQGWEYYCSEQLSIQTPGGWLSRSRTEEHTVLVFRKPREHLSPRIAAETGQDLQPAPRPVEAPRREPRLGGVSAAELAQSRAPADPFRPSLGPAEKG
jgi:hypothetical protein